MQSKRINVALALTASLWAAAALWVVWWPLLSIHRVTPALPLARSVVATHLEIPSAEVLTTVADASMVTDHPLTGTAAVTAARRILEGELALPFLPVLPVTPEFAGSDLHRGVAVQQLFVASLIVPDLLLRAYEHTPDPAFLAAARRYLVGFINYESGQWMTSTFLWNAHAVTNRVAVLARFWKFTRAVDPDDMGTAVLVHAHARRLGELLAKPALFIASTNHGMMQNLGLLELATAFPALPEAATYRQLALTRMNQQLRFYISREGVVLEHSAGYHFHGVVLLGFMLRVLEAGGEPAPVELQRAYDGALMFVSELHRADRSLPLVGNTYRYRWRLPRVLGVDEATWDRELQQRESSARLYPVSGYFIARDRETRAGVSTQTAVPWGYFGRHGHQRAQEMSLLIWADGTDWTTNTGYWPGDDSIGRTLAQGWDGGNGPHVLDESAASARSTTIRGYADVEGVRALDLERVVESGPRLRRQIVQVGGATWIALDTYSDAPGRPMRVLWTAAPEVEMSLVSPGQFYLQRDGSAVGMSISIDGSPDLTATPLRGSLSPFGGWVAVERRPVPAPGIDARLAAPSGWMLTSLHIAPATDTSRELPRVANVVAPDQWEFSVAQPDGELRITRLGPEIAVRAGPKSTRFTLQAGPSVAAEHRAIATALAAVGNEFPRFRSAEAERTETSLMFGAVGSVLLAVLLRARRWRKPRLFAMWLCTNAAWFGMVGWFAYFPVGQ